MCRMLEYRDDMCGVSEYRDDRMKDVGSENRWTQADAGKM